MAISPVHSAPAGSPPEGEDPAAPNGQAPDERSAGGSSAGHAGAGEPATPAPGERACANCGAALAPGQDWCLQCGAGAPGSLGSAGWRSAAVVLGAVAVLALGAAAAAYAALNKGASKAHVLTTTVAQATVTPPTGTPTTPTSTLPTTPSGTASTPKAAKGLLGLGGVKPPKIPLTAVTPTATTPSTTTSPGADKTKTTASTPTSTTPASTSTPSTGETSEESQQAAILLDPDAATTYNPYEYPASLFGDPSLAIDDDISTAWTAQVNPAAAPKMAVGLLIDLKSKQKVSVAQLVTSTPGMTVQVYGTSGQTAPTSITDPAWIALSGPKVAKKKRLRLTLRDSKQAFTYITLWISKAPQSAIGTAQAPGHVDVNELELFPTS